MKKIVIGIGGASGSAYARVLLGRLRELSGQIDRIGMVLSENARLNWELEHGSAFSVDMPHLEVYDPRDFRAPFASGSARYDTMIVCPCSMGLLGRIASGVSDDLMTRAADVILKERRRLILVTRETPLSLIHIRNMATVTEAGAIVCPAVPSFYSNPSGLDDLLLTVIDRVLDLAGFQLSSKRWNDPDPDQNRSEMPPSTFIP